jgi:predicted PurR-regulated permease PerM
LPAIIWIWTVKDPGAAVLITIYLVLVGLSDNALRPILMARGLSTPALVIFMGVLGGTLAHGIVGLFVGPIILAVAWELLMAWGRDEAASSRDLGRAKSRLDLNQESTSASDHRAEWQAKGEQP